jgi:hypothetical protein
MNKNTRHVFIVIGGILGAGLVHNVLPLWDIWIRAAITAAAAIIIAGSLMLLLPYPPKA